MDPEVLDSTSMEDGKQRGLYYIPSSQGRSPESAGEFVNSIFEVSLLITAYSQGQHHHIMSELSTAVCRGPLLHRQQQGFLSRVSEQTWRRR